MQPYFTDIRDIKPPVEIPAVFWWALIVLGLLALAGLAYVVQRRKQKAAPAVLAPARPPWEIALERLEDLRHQHYPDAGLFKPFYSGLSDIVRHYLEDRFALQAPEMTTEEFLNHLQNSPALNAGHKELLRDFLNGSDMVKFARHVPTVKDAQANFDQANKLILETKDGI